MNKIETQRAMSVAKCQRWIINVEPNSEHCSSIHRASGISTEGYLQTDLN